MIKRIRWMVMGAAAGVGAYLWLTQRAKEAVPQAGTDALRQARDIARDAAGRVREALAEGSATARDTNRELRRELLNG